MFSTWVRVAIWTCFAIFLRMPFSRADPTAPPKSHKPKEVERADLECSRKIINSLGTKESMDKIFAKYGNNKSLEITRTNFKKILRSLEIGGVWVQCEADDVNCNNAIDIGHKGSMQGDYDHKHRRKRDLERLRHRRSETDEHAKHWRDHLQQVSTRIK